MRRRGGEKVQKKGLKESMEEREKEREGGESSRENRGQS